MSNDMRKILLNDAASCVAVHPKFLCVGTHLGIIRILDHNGNHVSGKELPVHSVAVNQISIDANGDHIASCSDDGKVFVFGLYNTDNNQDIVIGRLVKTVAIDPNYYKSGSGRRVITGDDRLMIHEKTFLSRVRSTLLVNAGQEGGVKSICWSPTGELIAWSTLLGFRVYDVTSRVSLGFVKWSKPAEMNLKCHMCWRDSCTLIVGWADTVRVCNVNQKLPHLMNPTDATPYEVSLVYTLAMNFVVCGVGPLEDSLVVLGLINDGDRPQLHIIEPLARTEYTNMLPDRLSLRGYNQYTSSDYSLECLVEESRYVIVSPKDIVVAWPLDTDDRIEWLLQHQKFETALEVVTEAVDSKNKPLATHSKLTVGTAYIDYLLSIKNYQEAASLCCKIFGDNVRLWEKEVYKFARAHQLRAVRRYLPLTDNKLPKHIYEMVLYEYLKMEPQGFLDVVKEWPANLYNIPAVVNAVIEHLLTTDPMSKETILEALAILYSLDGKHEKALVMYLKLRNKGVFELIEKHKLYDVVPSMVMGLMDLDVQQTVNCLIAGKDTINHDTVVENLKPNSQYLYRYLDELDRKSTKLAQKYHGELVRLYADFNREKLLPLLRKSEHYPIQATIKICKERKFIKETVHLLEIIGNTKEALSLITKELGNIEQAVDLCISRDDLELWEDLISYSLSTQSFIIYLLKRIGTYIDPRILVERIESHMKIPGLKDALVKMLQDYSLQVSVQEGFKEILVLDYYNLHHRLVSMQQRGISIGGK
ncbi:hypothetical protein AAG570_002423 [Ranatra chinensis]|uniref:Vps41 beta-propeller domain-containing protein n=1 Tax=Ranatra chinensis TaxID=642074 RepID=A0ABD0YU75_9HEMI